AIKHAMLGTTHATNAIVERKRLNSIAIIRLGAPATLAVKPLIGTPEDLREKLSKYTYIVRGGHEFDGREISSLDEEHLYEIANVIKDKVDSIAIRSEEHTSELQSRFDLVCRLLLEKKKN